MAKTKPLSKREQASINIKLVLKKSGKFYFRKKADNGEDITNSAEFYDSKQGALKGLASDTMITLNNIADAVSFPIQLKYVDLTGKNAAEKILTIKGSYKSKKIMATKK